MITTDIRIVNKLGLHARPSAKLVNIASQFESEIMLKRENLEVNAKSIMGVMMLAAEMGSVVTATAEGPDEKDAIEAIIQVFNSKFGEE
jgi:phosphocarrier protein HPr